ncbi:MAG: alpha-L-arabinofuranosidase C-terminal domain-containing protein [Candidatus Kryptoniota bacterium]
MVIEQKITTIADVISLVKSKYMLTKPIYIAFDEWGVFGNSLLPTLAMAQYLNSFIPHANVVKMANFTMFTSILDPDMDGHMFKSPLFYTFKLFSTNCRGTSLNALVQCDTFSTSRYYAGIPYLDVAYAYAKDSKSLVISVVNRNKDKAIAIEIVSNSGTFAGKTSAEEINSDDIQSFYVIDKQKEYLLVPKEIEAKGHKFIYSFPSHSFMQKTVKID